jgi:hypothetical protein
MRLRQILCAVAIAATISSTAKAATYEPVFVGDTFEGTFSFLDPTMQPTQNSPNVTPIVWSYYDFNTSGNLTLDVAGNHFSVPLGQLFVGNLGNQVWQLAATDHTSMLIQINLSGGPFSTGLEPALFETYSSSVLTWTAVFEPSNQGTYGGTLSFLTFDDENDVFRFGGTILMASPVPEPSTWAMLLLGFAGIWVAAYRKRRHQYTFVPSAVM